MFTQALRSSDFAGFYSLYLSKEKLKSKQDVNLRFIVYTAVSGKVGLKKGKAYPPIPKGSTGRRNE